MPKIFFQSTRKYSRQQDVDGQRMLQKSERNGHSEQDSARGSYGQYSPPRTLNG